MKFMPIAVRSAVFSVSVAMLLNVDAANTYYLSGSETKFTKACVDASKWKDAAGNAAGVAGAPLTAEDFYVIRSGRAIRTYADDGTTPTIFTCKRLVIGEVSGTTGKINSYGRGSAAYVDFGSGEAQDGVYFANGSYMGLSQYSRDYNTYFRGKMTVTAPAGAPFVISLNSSRYKSMTMTDGLSWLSSEVGTALKIGGPDGTTSTQADFKFYLYADVSKYYGKLIVAPCCVSHAATPNYITTLYLDDGVFPGTLELQGGARLSPKNAECVVKLGNAVFADDSALVFPVADVEGDGGVVRPQSAQVVVTNDLTISGTVGIILSQIPAKGETNRFALVTAGKGSFDVSDFAMSLPASMSAHGWYLKDCVSLSIETNDAANTQTLYVELQPLVKLAVTDNADKTVWHGSALNTPGSWSDGKSPHSGAHYIVPNGSCLNTASGDYEFPGESLTVESGATLQAWNSDSTLKIPVLRMLGGSQVRCGQGKRVDFAGTHMIAESGVVTLMAFGGEAFNAKMDFSDAKISGEAELCINAVLTSIPRGNYYLWGDNSEFTGTITLKQTAAAAYASSYSALWVAKASDIGAPLAAMNPAALYLSNYGRLVADADVTIPASANRGLTVCGVGVVYTGANSLALGMPLTVDGTLYKDGAGTLRLDADRAGIGENGGAIVVTNGTLAVAAADAVNGFAVHLAPDAALSLKVDLADESLTRYGIRNVGLAEPFVLGAGVTSLPLSVDVANAPLPKRGGTIGVLTVSDSATNAIEQVFSVPKSYRGFRFTRQKLHDDENGWTTYAAKYEPIGCIISIW